MSVANLITTLISGIRDPATRMDVASTINYLLDLYSSRMITDEEVFQFSLLRFTKNVLKKMWEDFITFNSLY
jgi:hypothetical protein